MKIIRDSLKAVVERWDDPGDREALGGPRPSYDYVSEVAGEVVLELESEDFLPSVAWDVTEALELAHGIKVKKWKVAYRPGTSEEGLGTKVVLTVEEFDAERVEREYVEREAD